MKKTMQLAKMVFRHPIRRKFSTRTLHLNVFKINATESIDPLFANLRSIYHGYTCTQTFFGLIGHIMNVYRIKCKNCSFNVYKTFIRKLGYPVEFRKK